VQKKSLWANQHEEASFDDKQPHTRQLTAKIVQQLTPE
jgi:hypothetical protein